MPTEGFEDEILYLIRRMKERIDQRGPEGTTRRARSMSSKFERELKKLEWTMSYKRARNDSGLDKSDGAFILGR